MSPFRSRCLVIFARDPIPGRVKTRLIPALGKDGAAAVYRQMLQDTIATAAQAKATRHELWTDSRDGGPLLARLAQRDGMLIRTQCGGDIGLRMQNAFATTLGHSDAVVLIGTDCPEYDAAYLDEAFAALEQQDAVIGPAADGGYALIGLRSLEPAVFEGIPWGSAQVLAATRRRFARLHWNWLELPTLHDVDEYRDLLRFPRLGAIAKAAAQDRTHE